MATATVTSKGQITIPAETRERLRLKVGSKIDFVENRDGEIVLRPRRGDIRKLKELLNYTGSTVTLEEMDDAIAEAAVARYRRSSE